MNQKLTAQNIIPSTTICMICKHGFESNDDAIAVRKENSDLVRWFHKFCLCKPPVKIN